MDTPYESPYPSRRSQFGETPTLELDYDILNNTSYLNGVDFKSNVHLDALDFDSDFILFEADVDGTLESWSETNFSYDWNLPPFTDALGEAPYPLEMDLPGMDISQDTDNQRDPQPYKWFAGGLSTPARSPKVSSTTDLKYPCSHCHRSFRREGDRRKHVRIHTRPIQCPVPKCNGAFAQQRECDRHMESKHKSAATKRTDSSVSATCWTCGRAFARKDALKRHFARIHKVHVSFRSKSETSPATSYSSGQSETSPDTVLSER